MCYKNSCKLIAFALFASSFLSSQTTDLLQDGCKIWWNGYSEFYSSNGDKIVKLEDFQAPNVHANPRPKIRFNCIWSSDGKTIVRQLLQKEQVQKNSAERIKTPKEIGSFSEFELIDDDKIILWGVSWNKNSAEKTEIDSANKKISAVISISDAKVVDTFEIPENEKINNYYDMIKTTEVFSLYCYPKICFIGRYSGYINIYDVETKNLSLIKCLRSEELPRGKESVNNGPAVGWATPISFNELLVMANVWLEGDQLKETIGTWVPVFKRVDICSKWVSDEMPEFMDKKPDIDHIYSLWGSRLLSVDQIAESTKNTEVKAKNLK